MSDAGGSPPESFPTSSLRSSSEKLSVFCYRIKIVSTCYCNSGISDKPESSQNTTIIRKTSELLPIIGMDKGLFCMSDGSYMDIFRIVTKDLISAAESEIELDMLQWEKFYKMYAADCKIIGINFPTDTKRQQQYYQHKIHTADNPLFKEVLQTKYEELVDVNLYYTDREYYLMIFCPSYEKYLEARNIITVTLKNVGLISDISVKKKIMILTKLCNKATSVYG